MFGGFSFGQQDSQNPIFKLGDSNVSVNNLSPSLTINSQTVTPTFLYNLSQASAAELPAVVGDTLLSAGSGTDPNPASGSALLGVNTTGDRSVIFNAGKYHQAGDTTSGDITTEDFVFEMVFKKIATTAANRRVFEKKATNNGYSLLVDNTLNSAVILSIGDGTSTSITSGNILEETWVHLLVFGNRDEASTNGSQVYVNGLASGSGVDISARGSLTNASAFTVGAQSTGSNPYLGNVAYVSMWKQAAWHQAGAAGPTEWATVAKARSLALATSGLAGLTSSLTINSTAVSPSLRYEGRNATAATWTATSGVALPLAGSGTAPQTGGYSPFGNTDDSVLFNGGKAYQAGNTTLGDITTEDFVFEVVFKATSLTGQIIFAKRTQAVATGYVLAQNAGSSLSLVINDGSTSATITTANLTAGRWYHLIGFFNRDEASTNGSQWYLNGVSSGTGTDLSAIGSITVAQSFTIGAYSNGTIPGLDNIAHTAMWKQASWHQAGAAGPTEWATVAADRFYRLTGLRPSYAAGTYNPTTATRATAGYLDKVEGATRKLYQVGPGWLRSSSRKDSNGVTVSGLLVEVGVTNQITRSETFESWGPVGSRVTFSSNATAAPNGETTADGLIPSIDNNDHRIQLASATLSAAPHTFSVFAKKGNYDWILLASSTIVSVSQYFNINTGVLGTTGAAVAASYIENYGNGWYRCSMVFNGTAAANTVNIYIAEADTDITFIGDGATIATYVWGAQVELGSYPSSYIPTVAAAVARNADVLTYSSADGNIGGTGSDQQGTLTATVLLPSYASTDGYIASLDNTAAPGNNSLRLYLNNENFLDTGVSSTGFPVQLAGTSDITNGVKHQLVYRWANDSIRLDVDKVKQSSGSSVTIPTSLSSLYIGQNIDGTGQLGGLIGNIRIAKKNNRKPNPLFEVFNPSTTPGIDNLTAALVINGTSVTPTFRYKGGDATTLAWNAYTYGSNLAIAGSGSDPTPNNGSPLLGTSDDSVLINTGKSYQAADAAFADITTEDLVMEVLFKADVTGTAPHFFNKRESGIGYSMQFLGGGDGRLDMIISTGVAIDILTASLTHGLWYHVIGFINRDEASTNGAQMYVNGVASGSGGNPSSVSGSITSPAVKLVVGANSGLTQQYSSNLAYLAMWKQASWHQAGAAGPAEWATIAADRFYRLTGLRPNLATGTYNPTTATRATAGYLDKVEGATRKLYQVGSGWTRSCNRTDSLGRTVKGLLVEPAVTNLCLQSETFGTTWTPDSGTVSANAIAAPNGETTADGLVASVTDASHFVRQSLIPVTSGVTYTLSCFMKTGNKNVALLQDTATAAYTYVTFNTATLQTSAQVISSSMENYGNGWYRVSITYVSTTTGNTTFLVGPVAAVGTLNFAGDAATVNTYVWGAQLEAGDRPSSYIPTVASTVTRNADVLIYKGDDGNTNAGSGTMVADVLLSNYNTTDGYVMALDNSTQPGNNSIRLNLNNDDLINSSISTAGVPNQLVGTSDISDGKKHQVRQSWDTNDVKLYVDGVQQAADTSAAIPTGLDKIYIGSDITGTSQINGIISNVRIFKKTTI